LRFQLPFHEAHQIEIDAFVDERVAGAKEIFDRVERPDDLSGNAGLLENFSEGRLFGCFTFGDGSLGKAPSRATAGCNEGNVQGSPTERDHRAP